MSSSNVKHVDVLIVGAGPAGLTASSWMARCGVQTLLVDKRSADVRVGQADGVQARTLEILDSLGLADTVWKESYHLGEMCVWVCGPVLANANVRYLLDEQSPGPDGLIGRSSRMANTVSGLSRYRQGTILGQHRLEEIFLSSLAKYKDLEIQRPVILESLGFNTLDRECDDTYPITVTLRTSESNAPAPPLSSQLLTPPLTPVPTGEIRSRLAPSPAYLLGKSKDHAFDPGPLGHSKHAGTPDRHPVSTLNHVQTVKAKYLIGCDGAHSWTREQLGLKMIGEQTDYVWGVIDIIPITNFPDIRSRCAIHSAKSGTIMLIPREGRLIRLYCQLSEVDSQKPQRFDRSNITRDMIFRAAQEIFKPYTLEYTHCDWWTVYQIGQRVAPQFNLHNRIFLAGDAVHTHSPKAGQGMNVSIQDCYNLGWKLALVLKGFAQCNILSTYQAERRSIALQLIAFDQEYSRLWSKRAATSNNRSTSGSEDKEFENAFNAQKLFSSGFAVDYGPSMLITKPTLEDCQVEGVTSQSPLSQSKQHIAVRIPLGKRFPSHKVVNHSDARPWHFAEWLKADGRFRIVLFAGDVSKSAQMQRVKEFCIAMSHASSFLNRTTVAGVSFSAFIEILTIHSAPREAVDLASFPELLHPFDEALGWDYDKIYVDGKSYYEEHGEAYKGYGVDRQTGCVVVVRPDQHVGWIGEIEDTADLQAYFKGFVVLDQ